MIFNAVQRSAYFPEANRLLPRILDPYLKKRYLCVRIGMLAKKARNSNPTNFRAPHPRWAGGRAVRHTGTAPWPRSKRPEATSPIDIQAGCTLCAHVDSRQSSLRAKAWHMHGRHFLRHTLYTEQRERRGEAAPGEAVRG